MADLVRGGMAEADLAEIEWHVWQARVTGETVDTEAMNILSAHWYAADRDTPAKAWWSAADNHPAIYRALQIDPTDPAARFAAAPFRLWKSPDGQWLVIAAHPTPRMCGPVDLDHLGIETVLTWCPKSNRAAIMGDDVPQLAGAFTDDTKGAIYNDPRAFFRAWVENRAQFLVQCQTAASKNWHVRPVERDLVPGALIVGDADKVRWNPATMPETLHCVGIAPSKINKALIKAARLPFAVGSELRVAA